MHCPQCDAELSRDTLDEGSCPHCAANLKAFRSPSSGEELTLSAHFDPDLGGQETAIHATDQGAAADDKTAVSDETVDKKVGRYFVQREVGRGGMGVVYKARDERLGRSLALKIMRGGSEVSSGDTNLDTARFLEEARLSAQLDHPGLVPVHDLEQDPNLGIYFTMRLVKGKHLGEIFRYARENSHGWNIPRAVGAVVKACDAIAYAHSKKVIHRDLKPSNIMVGRFGAVYVMDWGLAKVSTTDGEVRPPTEVDFTTASQTRIQSDRRANDPSSADTPLITMDGSVVGTPAYMPPEQAKGRIEAVDELSDIYSIGTILYQLLTGHPPYVEPQARVSRHTILGMVIQGPPARIEKINPNAPAELVAICDKAMAREKCDRYATSLELAEDLQAYLDGRVVRAYRTGAVAEFRSWVSRNRATAAAAMAVIFVAVATLAGIVAVQSRHNREIRQAREATRRYLFDGNMQMVQQAWDDGGVLRARELLDRHRPKSGEDDVRSFAWYYFDNLCRQSEQAPRLVHDDIVTHVRFSPNGKVLATGCNDGAVRIWDTVTWTKRKLPLAHTAGKTQGRYAAVDRILFADDSKRLFSAGRFGDVMLRDIEGDREPLKLKGLIYPWSMTGDGNNRFVGAAAKSRDRIFVWDVKLLNATNLEPMVLTDPEHPEPIFGPAHFLLNPERVCAMGKDGLARLWSLDTGEVIQRFGEPQYSFNPLVHVSEDGRRLAKTSALEVEVYDIESGELIKRVSGPAGGARHLNFSRGGDKLAASSVSLVGDVLIWRVTDESVKPISSGGPHGGKLSMMRVIPGDRDLLVTSGGRANVVFIRDFKTGEIIATLRGHTNEIYAMDASADGAYVASGGRGGEVRIWDLNQRQPNSVLAHDDAKTVWCAAISPDASTILTAASDGHVRIWDAKTGEFVGKMEDNQSGADAGAPAHGNSAQFVLFPPSALPDRDTFVSSGRDHKIRLWSLSRRTLIGEISPAHDGGINALAFSPDGQTMYSAGDDGFVYAWRFSDLSGFKQNVKPVRTLGPIGVAAWGLAHSPTENIVAAAGMTESHDIYYWNLDDPAGPDGTLSPKLLSGHENNITTLQFSPDGATLASTSQDGSTKLWKIATGEELPISPLKGHSGDVQAVAYSPDGKSIFTGSTDGSIRVWDSVTGESKCSLLGHSGHLHCVVVSGDGSMVVSSGWDGTARLWRTR